MNWYWYFLMIGLGILAVFVLYLVGWATDEYWYNDDGWD